MARVEAHSQDELASALARRTEELASSERELKALLGDAHEQVAERDRELRRLLGELEAARAERDREAQAAVRAHAELAGMRRTRLWRAGATWWWLRDVALRRNRGG